jgi:hypothetical protein
MVVLVKDESGCNRRSNNDRNEDKSEGETESKGSDDVDRRHH